MGPDDLISNIVKVIWVLFGPLECWLDFLSDIIWSIIIFHPPLCYSSVIILLLVDLKVEILQPGLIPVNICLLGSFLSSQSLSFSSCCCRCCCLFLGLLCCCLCSCGGLFFSLLILISSISISLQFSSLSSSA